VEVLLAHFEPIITEGRGI